MQRLILFGVAGFVAQLVDGAIGMGYGLTSSSMLLAMGITPAVASASIHLAEIATTAASGVSHVKLGNVDRSLVQTLIVPGAVGAFVGACFLSNIPGRLVAPFIAVGLLLLGVYVMAQYLLRPARRAPGSLRVSAWKMAPLAVVAGFFDSVGGGGWGPISTPVLLAHRGSDPRKVVGSVDASEFFVTVAGTLGFVIALGLDDINWQWVGIFAVSGLLAAPLAAWLVRLMPVQLLGVVVGGAIILTNSRTLMMSQSVSSEVATLVYGVLLVGWALALGVAGRRVYRLRRVMLSEAL
ncbi:sulfite exporter TauE/SafE family protein [Larsenimonas rhizosphaerae]|uniref:sulfite exporter TauE/SafE family protein n=1 Tax=Larsenimonas rhizosphaerae TaxID=2944682 RepID=UPI002033B7D1|nr:sulfite exporter TauE/SafE family protein [Larsenimonas rhizosphaerae]MCM2131345.1 sulfite exporter TauE/SafE family protein [Larsenimonas rhizosphaerae]